MKAIGSVLVAAGIVLFVAGFLCMAGDRLRLGRLPGDIQVNIPGGQFSFPLATCILISLALTAVVNLAVWLLRC